MANTALPRATAKLNFVEGQLLTYVDLRRLQEAARGSVWELLAGRLYLNGTTLRDGFFGDDCKVTSSGGLNYSVAPGLGLFYDSTVSDEFAPQYAPIVNPVAATGALGAHDATHPRIDIICLGPDVTTDTSETINVMAADRTTSSTTSDRRTLYSRALQVVAGTPAASPAAPATPSGYLKVAECLVPAVAGSITVTDSRALLTISTGAIGVGGISTDMIADLAVTNAKIDDGTIESAKLAAIPFYAGLTAGAEVANVVTVDIQIKDMEGNNLTGIRYLELTLADVNHVITSAGDYYLTLTTGTRVSETHDPVTGATPYLLIATNGSGVAQVTITDAAPGVNRSVRLFAQPMGGYGARKYVSADFN